MTNWLTLEETAKYLKVGKSILYDLAHKGRVPAHKLAENGDLTWRNWIYG
ncbi:excisionase family DNA-binding protein [Pseudodesulfovibrio alkaliphilus]